MFISEPNFYYYLAFSTIPFMFAVILGFFNIYPMVKKGGSEKEGKEGPRRILRQRSRIRLSGVSRL